MIDWQSRIDFSQYYDLTDTFRERGDAGAATAVYRALAKAISTNLDRVEDSSG